MEKHFDLVRHHKPTCDGRSQCHKTLKCRHNMPNYHVMFYNILKDTRDYWKNKPKSPFEGEDFDAHMEYFWTDAIGKTKKQEFRSMYLVMMHAAGSAITDKVSK